MILQKQRQKIESFDVTVDGKRRENEIPAVFEKINVHFLFSGELDRAKVKRAIDLSMDKYCSVSAMLSPAIKITTSFVINKI